MSAADLHRRALDYLDQALVVKSSEPESWSEYLRTALKLEMGAADAVANSTDLEPTRSILHRSAASIALDLHDFVTAERYIARALAGFPPEDVAQELRDLYEQVNFKRHLALRGMELQEDEFQLSVSGPGVNFGMAPAEAFLSRFDSTEKLLLRTAERKRNRPYRRPGASPRSIAAGLKLYLSVPRAASFAVSVRLARPEQMRLDGFDDGPAIIDELLECMELFNGGNEKALRERIEDEDYFVNFVGLARNLAPDGRDIDVVGFTTFKRGVLREVALTKQREELPLVLTDSLRMQDAFAAKLQPAQVTGILKRADALKENKITVKPKKGKPVTVVVPEGLIDDIVRPMWGKLVTIKTEAINGHSQLVDIRTVENGEEENKQE